MTITKKDKYLYIAEADNLNDAVEASLKEIDEDVFAVVYCVDGKTVFTPETEKALAELPVISAAYSPELSVFSPEILMCFDLRFSDTVFTADMQTAERVNSERFGLLFGYNRKNKLEECLKKGFGMIELDYFSVSSESTDDYFTRIFREKSNSQLKALTECLVTLRSGIQENSFIKESENFYKLIKDITKE